jgi:hypothetical protein
MATRDAPENMDGSAVGIFLKHTHAGPLLIRRIVLHDEPVGGQLIVAVVRHSDVGGGDQLEDEGERLACGEVVHTALEASCSCGPAQG